MSQVKRSNEGGESGDTISVTKGIVQSVDSDEYFHSSTELISIQTYAAKRKHKASVKKEKENIRQKKTGGY